MLFIKTKMKAKEKFSLFLPLLLCASLIHMSMVNILSHNPANLVEFSEHVEFTEHKEHLVSEHGHSHIDFHNHFEDFYWLLHGHAHDNIDHDHSAVVMIAPPTAALLELPFLESKGRFPPIKLAALFLQDPPPRA